MDFNYFDLAAAIIILLLGLKGIINGFFKELFGLVGIVGGIFIASRLGDEVGQKLSDTLFHFESSSAVAFTGFLFTFVLFWIGMIFVGMLFKKLSSASGLGAIDRVFGFIIGSGKFFLIASVIAYALFNINAVRTNLEKPLQDSVVFPVMVEVGGYVMHIDTEKLGEEIDKGVNITKESLHQSVDKTSKAANELVIEHSAQIVEDVKEHIESDSHAEH
ncbi:MAG: CvpA family protein [Epsilonproteobacteria bacterium]|nr:MAG: CvpA family protein [Campylobacterota bacterium]